MKEREEVHLIQTSNSTTVQELAVKMQHAKEKESRDPLMINDETQRDSDDLLSDPASMMSDDNYKSNTSSEVFCTYGMNRNSRSMTYGLLQHQHSLMK